MNRLPFRHLHCHSIDSRGVTDLDFLSSKSCPLSGIFSFEYLSLRKFPLVILRLGLTASWLVCFWSVTSVIESHASIDLERLRGSRDNEIRQLDDLCECLPGLYVLLATD